MWWAPISHITKRATINNEISINKIKFSIMAVHHIRVFWSFSCLEKSSIARQLKPSVRAQCINNPTAHIIKTQATELFYSFAPAEPLAFVSVVVGGSLGFLGHTEWPRKSRIVFPGIFGSGKKFRVYFHFRKVPMGHLLLWTLSGEVPTQLGLFMSTRSRKSEQVGQNFQFP